MATFLDRIVNAGNVPLLEQTVRFTGARHRLIAENVANVDTPGYRQRDLSPAAFESALRDRVDERAGRATGSVRFEGLAAGVEADETRRYVLSHDGNNRSMEHLMSDMASNGLRHNLSIELLRRQFSSIESALKERVS